MTIISQWTAERDGKLRALWESGLSTAEIARRIGATKSAVIGRAHRLKLASRPSPIIRADQPIPAHLSNWDAERDAKLRDLWGAGVSMVEIGRRLRCSKTTVASRARKIGLASRTSAPSSIASRARAPRARVTEATHTGWDRFDSIGPLLRASIARHTPQPVARPGTLTGPIAPARTCQYPRWPDGARPPRPALFCGAPAQTGQSWCASCAAIVWGAGTPSERAAGAVLQAAAR